MNCWMGVWEISPIESFPCQSEASFFVALMQEKTQLVEPASLDTSVNMTYIDLNMRSILGPKSCLVRETEIMGKSSFRASLVYLW